MTIHISHDPFARQSYRRTALGEGECRWCGSLRKPLYSYTLEPDDRLRPTPASRLGFCTKSCFDSYHD
jgi:hypothetical protein